MSEQRLKLFDINQTTLDLLNNYLAKGYKIIQIIPIESINKLLVLYVYPGGKPLNDMEI